MNNAEVLFNIALRSIKARNATLLSAIEESRSMTPEEREQHAYYQMVSNACWALLYRGKMDGVDEFKNITLEHHFNADDDSYCYHSLAVLRLGENSLRMPIHFLREELVDNLDRFLLGRDSYGPFGTFLLHAKRVVREDFIRDPNSEPQEIEDVSLQEVLELSFNHPNFPKDLRVVEISLELIEEVLKQVFRDREVRPRPSTMLSRGGIKKASAAS